MIGIGMVSFWHLHGKDYAQAAEANPETQIVAVWDEDPERGRREAATRGVPYYADLAELLADTTVDAVVVDCQTNFHAAVITQCAAAGKHIFAEKVVAATVVETDQILAAVAEADVAFAVSLWRSDRAYTHQIADLIESGVVGEVTALRIRDGHPLALPTAEAPDGALPPQFFDPVQAQGGILIDLCHPLYLTARFLGLPESVQAHLGRVTGRAVDDNAVVTMRYPNGALAIAETSSTSAVTPFSIEVHGTLGSIVFAEPGIGEMIESFRTGAGPDTSTNGPDGTIRVRSIAPGARPTWESQPLGESAPMAFDQWVEQVQTGSRNPDNVQLARQLSVLVEAAYRSDVSGTRVTL